MVVTMFRYPTLTKFLPVAICNAWWNAWLDLWDLFGPAEEHYEDNFGDHGSVNAEVGGGD